MGRPESEIALDEAALLIAAHADPGLDVSAQLERLDALATQVVTANTEGVCRLVFETLGVRGDDQTYDDPRNSYLNQVLDRRLGIPITLSVLLIEIGRRCGVALEGVGMPGHFLVRDPRHPELLIDAFSGGSRLDHTSCARLLGETEITLAPGMLDSVGPRAIVSRMLANLNHSFARRRDQEGLRWVSRLRAAIPGLPPGERISLAESLAGLGCHDEAAALFEELARTPGVSREAALPLQVRARALLARFN